jgi:CIC family chloride channel protein
LFWQAFSSREGKDPHFTSEQVLVSGWENYTVFLENINAIISAAAFTGALLKAPLGSAIFAMELERTYNLNYKPLVPSLIASIVAYLTFSFFRGKTHFIPIDGQVVWDLKIIPYVVLMGLISSVVFIYSVFFHSSEQILKKIKNRYKRFLFGTFLASIVIYLLAFFVSFDILSAPAKMTILSYLAQTPIPLWKDFLLVIGIILATSFTKSPLESPLL